MKTEHWQALGIIAAFPILLFLSLITIAVFATDGVGAGLCFTGVLLGLAAFVAVLVHMSRRNGKPPRPSRYDKRAALMERADYQHAMLMAGYWGVGFYGNFQPPPDLRTPPVVL